jgi:hypothetical protein
LLANASLSHSDWMASIPANQALNRLLIPGTHDSGSYAINSQSKFSLCSDGALPEWLEKLSDTLPVSIVRAISANWAKTQPLSIGQQLEQGIRYLDLRVCYSDSTSHSGEKTFYLCHSLLGSHLSQVLNDIAQFAKKHPSEIILADLNHLYGVHSPEDQNALSQMIYQSLAPYLVSNQLTAKNSLQEIRASGRNVILLFDAGQTASDPKLQAFAQHFFWPQSRIQSPWPNTTEINKLKKDLDGEADHNATTPPQGLFVYQAILTPNSKTVSDGIWGLGSKPYNIPTLEKPVNQALPGWIQQEEDRDYHALNIIEQDWFDEKSSLVDWAITYDT